MANDILINAPTVVGGKTVSTTEAADGTQHENTITEFVDAGGEPVKVSATTPLPVTDAVAETALASIAAEDFATHAAQIDNSQKTQIVDAGGNQVSVTGNKLDVNAVFSGDIEIGAVELKNGTDDTRAIITPANALKVDGSAVTQPVSGTFFQATQPVSGTFFQATQPVSAATLPLPTGAATAALQTQPGVDIGDVTVNNAAGGGAVNIQDGGNSITVDGTFFQATQPVSAAALPLPSGAATSANQQTDALTNTQLRAVPVPISGTVAVTGAGDASASNQTLQITQETAINTVLGLVADAVVAAGATGSISAKLRRATQGLEDLKSLIVLAAGTALIGKVGIDQTTPGTTNAVAATGNVANDAVDSGNPVKVGQKAISFGTNPTAVASGDRTDWYANIAGIPFMIGGHPNIVCFRATYTAAQTDTAIITIAGGLKIVVTRLTVTASAANTVNVSVIVGFGTANTPTTTGVVLSHPGLAPGSGVVEGNGAGILGVGADGADLRITSAVPTSGAIDVVVNYFTIES